MVMARSTPAQKPRGAAINRRKGGSEEGGVSVVPPFAKGGLGGISLQEHIKAAATLIAATGYHRRDPELAELQGLTR